jgi:hypothetical protein
MGRHVVAGNCQELLRRPAARPQPIAAPARAAFFVPVRRVRLTLQPNEAGCDPTQNLTALLRHPVGSRAAFSPPSVSTILLQNTSTRT